MVDACVNSVPDQRAVRSASLLRRLTLLLASLLPALNARAAAPPPSAPGQPEQIAEVRVLGNRQVPTREIMAQIHTRPGWPPDPELIQQDIRRLMATGKFRDVNVEYLHEQHGLVVLFRVQESNLVREIVIEGNYAISDAKLLKQAGLEAGRLADPALAQEAARQMEELYHKKGYPFARVELVEGNRPGDERFVFQVSEGPKVRVADVDFVFLGTESIGARRLATQIRTKRRKFFLLGGSYDARQIDDDVHRLKAYYRGLGYFDVRVSREIVFSEDRSKCTVRFVVWEGPRYVIRSVRFEGNRLFDEQQLRQELKLLESKPFNERELKADTRKLLDKYGSKGYIDARVVPDIRFLEQPGAVDLVYRITEGKQYLVGRIIIKGNEVTRDNVIRRELRIYPGEVLDVTALRRSEANLRNTRLFFTGGSARAAVSIQPVSAQTEPPAMGEGLPGEGPNIRDIEVRVQEGQTGRILFGIGVNSDAGLIGNIMISEQNFDLFRWPTDLEDLFSGYAFRGGGQEFRLEASPGTEFSRYLISWREPYLFDYPYSFGISGYFFDRFYRDYDEERGGGRISLGHRFDDFTRASASLRIENIEITNPDFPTPPDLLRVLGNNFQTVALVGWEHDTRDSPFLPGAGHLANVTFEYGFGDFDFPKVTLEGRQFWTLRQRPDGSGRHILSARGTVGFAGSDTPLYERFYAGGFRNFRGFRFRGVGPDELGVKVGGRYMMLGSLEYLLPLTADDMLNLALFSDFGTVEKDIELTTFRVTAGVGLRIVVPMLGPVPLAFDFAFPLNKADTDDTQVFSFFIGFMR